MTPAHQHVEQRSERVVAARAVPGHGRAAVPQRHDRYDPDVCSDARRDVARVVPRAARVAAEGLRGRRRQ